MDTQENLQHVQVPNDMGTKNLTPKDQLIYSIIKSHDNPTQGCFPSLQVLSKESGASINTVRDSIARLKEVGYIKTELRGRKTYYTFDPYKKFEPFSPDFIKREDLSFTTKSYLIASQQYMYKDIENIGKLSFSNRVLSNQINMPESTIRKCNAELISKDYLTIVKNENKELETGFNNETKLFNLAKLGQAVIWTICNHEDRIVQNTNDINELKERLDRQDQQIEEYKKLVEKLLQKCCDQEPKQVEAKF